MKAYRFTRDALLYRLKHGRWSQSHLAKAFKAPEALHILDTTAGYGEDAFILASLGHRLTLLERNETVYQALQTAIQEAGQHPVTAPIVARMTLHRADAMEYIKTCKEFDAMYLDPMFPHSTKSALVKQKMRDLRETVGADQDADALLPLAVSKARYRVVVKRPAKAPHLNQQTPDHMIKGKSNRYDIYINRSFRHQSADK